jgi:hypothetical protein
LLSQLLSVLFAVAGDSLLNQFNGYPPFQRAKHTPFVSITMFRAESVLRLWTSSRVNRDVFIPQSRSPAPYKEHHSGPENAFRGLSLKDTVDAEQNHVELPMDLSSCDTADETKAELKQAKSEIVQLTKALQSLQDVLSAQNRMHEALVAEQEAEILRLQDELRDASRVEVGLPRLDPWNHANGMPMGRAQRKSILGASGAKSTKRPCVEDSFDHEAMTCQPRGAVRAQELKQGSDRFFCSEGLARKSCTTSTVSQQSAVHPSSCPKDCIVRTPSGISMSAGLVESLRDMPRMER